jgi:hypothetical protein
MFIGTDWYDYAVVWLLPMDGLQVQAMPGKSSGWKG